MEGGKNTIANAMSEKLEQKCYTETFVAPQWLPGGKSFWYRQETENQVEFILVDIVQQAIRPAFNHEHLAKQLARHAEISIDSRSLPFTWIEIENQFIRFRFKRQIWQYDTNSHQLSEWEGEFTQGNPALTCRHGFSHRAHRPYRVPITFVNNTRSVLDMYSVGLNNGSEIFASIEKGQLIVKRLNVGSTWTFFDKDRLRGVYCVPDVTDDYVILDEANIDEYMGSFKEVLPTGWEERITPAGRIYYVDHRTKSTTWRLPINSIIGSSSKGESPIFPATAENHKTDGVSRDESLARPSCGYNDGINITVRQYNLWIMTTQERHQLSTNGTEDEPYDGKNIYSSPDKQFIVAWQSTVFPFDASYNIEYTPGNQIRPKLLKESIRLPGDLIRVDRPRLFDLSAKCEISTTDSLFTNPFCLYHIGWSSEGDEYRFVFIERGHKCVRVIGINHIGAVRIIIEETSQTFIDAQKMYYHFLSQHRTEKVIWASERDGYNHLYLVDLRTGRVQNQITKGEWNIRSVEHIDEETEEIWASVHGFWENQDPYHIHLIYVKFDGTDCRSLTEGDGTHRWSYPWAKDSRYYFVDTWSRVDLPPQTVIRSFHSGKLVFDIKRPTCEELVSLGWNPVQRFAAPGRDGKTQIYGLITLPPNFDKNKTFPVLEHIYAGPHRFSVIKNFDCLPILRELARDGYIVVQIDGMGTNWRSKAFHDICYKNLKDSGFPDRMLWMQQAAQTRPWMDLSRVGIIGNSAGGQNAAAALLHHGDFYKVAVSSSGCHDNRLNSLYWAEQWMGYPIDKSYAENSNITHASKLRVDGKLLLIAGGLDTIVNPTSTMRLATQLNKEGKEYDFFFIPEGDHNCADTGAGSKRVTRFLREHLKTSDENNPL